MPARLSLTTRSCALARVWTPAAVTLSLISSCAAGAATISIEAAAPGKPASPYLAGSGILWQRQGMGMLQTEAKVLRQPVAFSPAALKAAAGLKPPILRLWSGETYNFRDGIGPDRPRRFPAFTDWVSASDVGTDEFLAFCEMVGAEAMICVPYRASRDLHAAAGDIGWQLAANWVEYCNGISPGLEEGRRRGWKPTRWQGRDPWKSEVKVPGSYLSTEAAPAGYFAWLREYFGRREPYGVRFWEVGNEIYLFGPSRPDTFKPWAHPALYGANFPVFAQAMKAKDPTILVGADAWADASQEARFWNATVFGSAPAFSRAYQDADFLVLHEYVGPQSPDPSSPQKEYAALFGAVADLEARLAALSQAYGKPVVVSEYNVQYGVLGRSDPAYRQHAHRLKSALAVALMQNAFHRQGVMAACQFHLMTVGAWFQDDTFRMAFQDVVSDTGRSRAGFTPTYLALSLYSRWARGERLSVSIGAESSLDAVAFRDAGAVRLLVVNTSPAPVLTDITFNGAGAGGQVRAFVLSSDGGPEASNDVLPDRVRVTESVLGARDGRLAHTFAPYSLTVLDIPLAPAPESPLQVTISAGPQAPVPGQTVVLTVLARNTSSAVLSAAEVSVPVPDGAAYVEGSASGGGCRILYLQAVAWHVS